MSRFALKMATNRTNSGLFTWVFCSFWLTDLKKLPICPIWCQFWHPCIMTSSRLTEIHQQCGTKFNNLFTTDKLKKFVYSLITNLCTCLYKKICLNNKLNTLLPVLKWTTFEIYPMAHDKNFGMRLNSQVIKIEVIPCLLQTFYTKISSVQINEIY